MMKSKYLYAVLVTIVCLMGCRSTNKSSNLKQDQNVDHTTVPRTTIGESITGYKFDAEEKSTCESRDVACPSSLPGPFEQEFMNQCAKIQTAKLEECNCSYYCTERPQPLTTPETKILTPGQSVTGSTFADLSVTEHVENGNACAAVEPSDAEIRWMQKCLAEDKFLYSVSCSNVCSTDNTPKTPGNQGKKIVTECTSVDGIGWVPARKTTDSELKAIWDPDYSSIFSVKISKEDCQKSVDAQHDGLICSFGAVEQGAPGHAWPVWSVYNAKTGASVNEPFRGELLDKCLRSIADARNGQLCTYQHDSLDIPDPHHLYKRIDLNGNVIQNNYAGYEACKNDIR